VSSFFETRLGPDGVPHLCHICGRARNASVRLQYGSHQRTTRGKYFVIGNTSRELSIWFNLICVCRWLKTSSNQLTTAVMEWKLPKVGRKSSFLLLFPFLLSAVWLVASAVDSSPISLAGRLNLLLSICSFGCYSIVITIVVTSFVSLRKRGLLLNNATGILGAILMAFSKAAQSYEMLIIGRLIIGFNCGIMS